MATFIAKGKILREAGPGGEAIVCEISEGLLKNQFIQIVGRAFGDEIVRKLSGTLPIRKGRPLNPTELLYAKTQALTGATIEIIVKK
jgi:hypothetical protein